MKMNSKVKRLVLATKGLHLSLYIPLESVLCALEVCMAAVAAAQNEISFSTELEQRKFFEPIADVLKNRIMEQPDFSFEPLPIRIPFETAHIQNFSVVC